MNKAELKERVMDLLTIGDNKDAWKMVDTECSVDVVWKACVTDTKESVNTTTCCTVHSWTTTEYLGSINRMLLYKKEMDPKTNCYND